MPLNFRQRCLIYILMFVVYFGWGSPLWTTDDWKSNNNNNNLHFGGGHPLLPHVYRPDYTDRREDETAAALAGKVLNGSLSNEELTQYQTIVKARLVAAGYRESHIVAHKNGELYLGGALIQNDLFFTQRETTADEEVLKASVVKQVAALDRSILAFMRQNGAHTHGLRHRPGQGTTGRGWGITSPFSRKWRYYVQWLLKERRGKYMCEVGFLAGHSLAVFVGAARNMVREVHEFDVIQRGVQHYHYAGKQYFDSQLGHKFFLHEGSSCRRISEMVQKGVLRRCDFISLDGGKLVHEVLCDLAQFFPVSRVGFTIILTDDVGPELIRSSSSGINNNIAALKDHNDVLRYLVHVKALVLHDCFESDVAGWPMYGVCAFSYTAKFPELINPLLEYHLPRKST
eukprot:PhM_4_TR9634/c0_g1_i1/m.38205